jgi:hypothetical protein
MVLRKYLFKRSDSLGSCDGEATYLIGEIASGFVTQD